MNQKKSKIVVQYGLAFLIPVIVVSFVFFLLDNRPFGDNTILSMDLWGQYFPMYKQQSDLSSLQDLFYSWKGNLGFNNYAQMAYYNGGLSFLPYYFAKSEQLMTMMDVIAILKYGLCAITCLYFLQYKNRDSHPMYVVFAISYAFCSYGLAYISQCMWTDCLIYAPLILCGMDYILRENSFALYVISLSLCMISNFYIAFAICIFSLLYFIVEYICWRVTQKSTGKDRASRVLYFGFGSILSAMIAALILLPVAKCLSDTVASEQGFPDQISFYNTPFEYIAALLPSTKPSTEYGVPNISAGALVFAFLPLFFVNSSISKTRRISSAVLVVLLFFCMDCNVLNYIWHGFHFPNQLPGRWSFMFSLYLILLSAQSLHLAKKISKWRLLIAGVSGLALVIMACAVAKPEVGYIVLYVGFVLAVFAFMYFKNVHNHQLFKKSAAAILAVFFSALLTSAPFVLNAKEYFPHTESTGYERVMKRYENVMKAIPDETFIRMESYYQFTFNIGMLGNYNGITYYSSTMPKGTYRLFQYLGNAIYGKNVSTIYNVESPVQNALLSLSYMVDRDRVLANGLPGFTVFDNNSGERVYKSDRVLPIGFCVDKNFSSYTLDDMGHVIQNQNSFLNAMLGEECPVYNQLLSSGFGYTNCKLQENDNWNEQYYITEDLSQEITFDYEYMIEKADSIYLENNFRAGTIQVEYSDGRTRTINCGNVKFASLGFCEAGTVLRIHFSVTGYQIGCCGLNVYSLNEANWDRAWEKLSANKMDVIDFTPTEVTGRLLLDEEQLVFTSVPQDGGWQVLIDDKNAEQITLCDGALVGFYVPAGNHIVNLKYEVPGLKLGLIISGAGLLIFVVILVVRKRRGV